jgi:hypothetical protein
LIKNDSFSTITIASSFNQLNDFKSFLGNGIGILILYFISSIIVLITGTRIQKVISVYFPILLLLLVVNPLLTNIYIKVVTTATYWRLYWLFPIELTIVFAIINIYNSINKLKYNNFIIFISIIAIIILGQYMYTIEREFYEFENFDKVHQYIIDETNYILENSEGKVNVLAPSEPYETCIMRQFTTRIIFINARTEANAIYNPIYNMDIEEYDIDEINEIKNLYNIQWIILPKNKKIDLSNPNFEFVLETENENNYILKSK